MWSNTPRVIIRKLPSKELRLLVAKLSPFVKFINIYVKMYTLIVQALLCLVSLCPGMYLGEIDSEKYPKSE